MVSQNTLKPQNSLKKVFPKLAKEWDYKKNEFGPDEISYGSGKYVWWICSQGHSYKQRIVNRNPKGKSTGCPYCSGRKVGYGNDLKTQYPKLAKEWDYKKNEFGPDEITRSSHKKAWWICSKKHSYSSAIYSRVAGNNCPICANQKVGYGNDLKTQYPKLAKEWDYEKNEFGPHEVLPNTNKKIWWICKENHSYESSGNKRISSKAGCPYCSGHKVGYGNDLKTQYPKLAKEWDYKKNEFGPDEVRPGSEKKAWWICKKNHSYQATVVSRNPEGKSTGCPYCSGRKVGYGNDLKTLYPKIAKEWDYKKNKLGPDEVRPQTHKSAWWICSHGHSYKSVIKTKVTNIIRSNNPSTTGCPYCSSIKIGYGNDLKTQYPKLAKEWDYEKNLYGPEDVTPGSEKKAWWICKYKHTYYSQIYSRAKLKTGCPHCVLTPRSKDEIYILFELKKFFNISENIHKVRIDKLYDVDILIKKEKIIIEYDGAYWHKDKTEFDIRKTDLLKNNGWTVIRVREKPLNILSKKYNVSSVSQDYKNNTNKVLRKLNTLGFKINNLDNYLKRKTLLNKKEADIYIDNILKKKST